MPFRTADQAAPARYWKAVTPSDTVNLPAGCRGLYVTANGNIGAVGEDDVALTFPVTAGQVVPLAVKRINATNTTATVIALY